MKRETIRIGMLDKRTVSTARTMLRGVCSFVLDETSKLFSLLTLPVYHNRTIRIFEQNCHGNCC